MPGNFGQRSSVPDNFEVDESVPMAERLGSLLKKGFSGLDIVRYHAKSMDKTLSGLLPADLDRRPIAVFATGGYGRMELCPHSDVDVMFLVKDDSCKALVEDIYYRLIDTGINLSHSVRTEYECFEEARGDLRTRTSLLDIRLIAGSQSWAAAFLQKSYPEVVLRGSRGFFTDRLKEFKARQKKFGQSVFLLQPNVKESGGGLRDVHEAIWLSKIALGLKKFEDLEKVLSEEDYVKLSRAYDFLLRLRIALHLASGKEQDLLTFDFQRKAADMLDVHDTKYFSASERLLRFYYLKARTIKEITEKARNVAGSMYVVIPRSFRTIKINERFSLSQNKIMLNGAVSFRERPWIVVEAYMLHLKTSKSFTMHLRESIRKSLFLINKKVRASREAVRGIMDIFESERPYAALKMMHDDGVLDRFFPEFGTLRCRVVYEPYHIYTVDEHSLFAIKALEGLDSPGDGYDRAFAHVFNCFGEKEILYLSLLFHDVGKTKGSRHSAEGYKSIKSILDRLSLSNKQREAIEFLVKNHLLMSNVAFTMDVDDAETISDFADAVKDESLLNALFLVTYADMAAVSVSFLTPWRKHMLLELFNRTVKHLRGIVEETTRYLLEHLERDERRDEVMRFLKTMPRRYVTVSPPLKIVAEFETLALVKSSGFAVTLERKNASLTELTVCARDRPGLLASMVGVLSSRRLNIQSLRTFSSTMGLVIDRFLITNYSEMWWEGMDELIESELGDAVSGKESVPMRKYPYKDKRFSPFVDIDKDNPAPYPMAIEVMSSDRLGLLYDVTEAISQNGLDIVMSKVNTEADVAHDVFYVRAFDGYISNDTILATLNDIWKILN
ncbi:MAG: HD domain-containing protein [Nitrospirae bacterium]|nr:HD domain-containing protein [Nitrospirota bacterium]